MSENEKLVEVQHLQQYFPAGGRGKHKKFVQAVDDVSFFINRGETLGLVGESGCGKTTVGRTLLRLYEPTDGKIIYDGKVIFDKENKVAVNMLPYRRKMQMVFQDPYASLDPRMTIGDIVGEPIDIHHLAANKAERREKIISLLERVGLNSEHANRYPHEFSGGQRQRVGLARAMVMEPELVIADEPISALDVSIRAQILNLLNKFKRERNTTCLFIAHDLSIVRYISDRIGVIYKGQIVEIATSEELFNYPLHPYTRSLISAIPLPDPRLERNKVLNTYDPSQHNYTEADPPKLTLIGHDHYVYGNTEELEAYKALREKNVPLHTLFIVGVNAEAPEEGPTADTTSREVILDRPAGDRGSFFYGLLSFLLPIPGLLAAYLFRKHNYMRNYKVCRKGALASLICIGALGLLLGLLVLIALK